jgi:transketolase
MKAQRDVFLDELFLAAQKDPNIILISVDMGAPALDRWRTDLPNQFFSAGISEQNAINVASGLSSQNKKVFVYMMACWAARCFEQIRYSCAMAENAITILGNGVALGYAPAGPAHEPTEDIAYMRSLVGVEILSPASSALIPSLVRNLLDYPRLSYVRLERSVPKLVDEIVAKKGDDYFRNFDGSPYVLYGEPSFTNKTKNVVFFASGYILERAVRCAELLLKNGVSVSVVDVCRITTLNSEFFRKILDNVEYVITLEEQTLPGGFGSAILEIISDSNLKGISVLRIGLESRFIFENGTREELLDANGFQITDLINKVENHLKI